MKIKTEDVVKYYIYLNFLFDTRKVISSKKKYKFLKKI